MYIVFVPQAADKCCEHLKEIISIFRVVTQMLENLYGRVVDLKEYN